MTNQDEAEAERKAIKEGTIRQSLGIPLDQPASDTDREIAEELARQWNDEDVSCPPHRRNDDDSAA
jgi:hypothetical protein